MKKIIVFFVILFCSLSFSQDKYLSGNNPFQKPKEGKALVYIIRSGAGQLLNFRVYKNDKYLGPITSSDYLIVECEPGEHLFWAVSENRDFVEATLEANKVYVLNVEGQMGAFIASVALKPLNQDKKQDKNLFYRKIKNGSAIIYSESKEMNDDKAENITKGLEKYQDLKERNSSKIMKLPASMIFENANKFEKK